MAARQIGKLQVAIRQDMRIGGENYEAGEVADVFGERNIGMIGMQPDPTHFIYVAAFWSGKRDPHECYVSDGVSWKRMEVDPSTNVADMEPAIAALTDFNDRVTEEREAEAEARAQREADAVAEAKAAGIPRPRGDFPHVGDAERRLAEVEQRAANAEEQLRQADEDAEAEKARADALQAELDELKAAKATPTKTPPAKK